MRSRTLVLELVVCTLAAIACSDNENSGSSDSGDATAVGGDADGSLVMPTGGIGGGAGGSVAGGEGAVGPALGGGAAQGGSPGQGVSAEPNAAGGVATHVAGAAAGTGEPGALGGALIGEIAGAPVAGSLMGNVGGREAGAGTETGGQDRVDGAGGAKGVVTISSGGSAGGTMAGSGVIADAGAVEGEIDAGAAEGSAGDASGGIDADIEGATMITLANPIHVVAQAASNGADGSEVHPFTNLTDAVLAIRAVTTSNSPWDGRIIVHEGRYELLKTIELPDSTDIEFRAGVTMAMGSNVSLHANRSVKVLGNQEKRVVFTWLEENKPWGSFTLFVPGSQSNEFAWATFEHGGEVTYRNISVRGALSLESAGAHISHCTFQDNAGDDGLSLGSSPSFVEHSTFLNNSGDGIDVDGPSGAEIAFCHFEGNGNDGLDLGENADLWAHDNVMLNSGDTGIEVGEASHPRIDHNIVVGNVMGIGIKDDADPVVSHCTLYGNQYGITAYHFKSAYGTGKGTISNTIVWGSTKADVALIDEAPTTFSYSCVQSGAYVMDKKAAADAGAPIVGEGMIRQGAGCDDPLFVNPEQRDFHLMSTAGHWSVVTESWVVDDKSSPCIDRGDPQSAVADETVPNGGRVNLGVYGGTAEASRSPEPL